MVPGGQYIIEHKSQSDIFRIKAIGDIHWWNKACAADRLKADIQAVAKDVFQPAKLNLALIGPFKEKAEFETLLKL